MKVRGSVRQLKLRVSANTFGAPRLTPDIILAMT